MSASGIVPAFDEVEYGEARVGLGPEAFTIEQLALEGREEALAHRVVVRVAPNRFHFLSRQAATRFLQGISRAGS